MGKVLYSAAMSLDGYVSILGADIARQCLLAGELDEVFVSIVPVLLGDGTPLLHEPGGVHRLLETVRVTPLPHTTNVWMRVTPVAQDG